MRDLFDRFEASLEAHGVAVPDDPGQMPWIRAERILAAWFDWYTRTSTDDYMSLTAEEHELFSERCRLTAFRMGLEMQGVHDLVTSHYEAAILVGKARPDWKGYALAFAEAVHDMRDDDLTQADRDESTGRLWNLKAVCDRHIELEEQGQRRLVVEGVLV